jgi:hypothetical protein
MSKLPCKVFISYAHEDKASADTVILTLKSFEIESWIDQEEMRIGKPWQDSAFNGIYECPVVVVIITERATKSDPVKQEILKASELGRAIIGVIGGPGFRPKQDLPSLGLDADLVCVDLSQAPRIASFINAVNEGCEGKHKRPRHPKAQGKYESIKKAFDEEHWEAAYSQVDELIEELGNHEKIGEEFHYMRAVALLKAGCYMDAADSSVSIVLTQCKPTEKADIHLELARCYAEKNSFYTSFERQIKFHLMECIKSLPPDSKQVKSAYELAQRLHLDLL